MNSPNSWLQFALFVGALLLITKPLGLFLVSVLDPRGRTFLDRLVRPIERATYRVCGIDPQKEQSWLGYTMSLLAFSVVGLLFTYFILRFQDHLPLNPQNLPGLSPALAFNTAASFTTNTNWQSYGGESTMSYFSQMVALTIHNFTSAAAGIAIAAALVRGIARQAELSDVGTAVCSRWEPHAFTPLLAPCAATKASAPRLAFCPASVA